MTVSVSRQNMACPRDSLCLCQFQHSWAAQSAWISWSCQGHVQGWTFCRCTSIQVWLVPTVKIWTSETAAAYFVGSVFKGVGLQDFIVSTRFMVELWNALHETLSTSLVFGTPHHHHTTAKVEQVNWVLSEALSAFVNYRADNWDELIPLVEFVLNY